MATATVMRIRACQIAASVTFQPKTSKFTVFSFSFPWYFSCTFTSAKGSFNLRRTIRVTAKRALISSCRHGGQAHASSSVSLELPSSSTKKPLSSQRAKRRSSNDASSQPSAYPSCPTSNACCCCEPYVFSLRRNHPASPPSSIDVRSASATTTNRHPLASLAVSLAP